MTEEKKSKGQNGENSLNSPKKGGRIMSTDEKEQKSITRREFVKGAAVGAAAAVGAGVLASCATPTPEVIEVTKEVIKEVPGPTVIQEVIKEVSVPVPEANWEWELVNPTGSVDVEPMKLAPRITTLENKTVLLRFNGKPNADTFIIRLKELLTEAVPSAKVEMLRQSVLEAEPSNEAIVALKPDIFIAAVGD